MAWHLLHLYAETPSGGMSLRSVTDVLEIAQKRWVLLMIMLYCRVARQRRVRRQASPQTTAAGTSTATTGATTLSACWPPSRSRPQVRASSCLWQMWDEATFCHL